MRTLKRCLEGKLHRVWLVWGKHWAAQAYWYPCISFGIHVDPRRPLVDVHFLVFTFALGSRPVITDDEDRTRHTCRGFLFKTDPVL